MKLTVIKDKYFINHILYCFNDFIDNLSSSLGKEIGLRHNFTVNFIDSVEVNKNYKLVADSDFVYLAGFSGLNYNVILNIKKRGTKIIIFWDDIHYYSSDVFKNRIEMFSVADIILLPYYKQFLKRLEYKEYWDKAFIFPWYAPDICHNYETNFNERFDNAILTGRISDAYPFRKIISQYKQSYVVLLEHPGYDRDNRKHDIIHENFYRLLSKYKFSIVTTAKEPLNYTLAKYFEIPACGCIPLMQETDDFIDLGFIKDVNYISINLNNYKNIENIVKEYNIENIRKNNLEFIKSKHSINNRIELLFKIINNWK